MAEVDGVGASGSVHAPGERLGMVERKQEGFERDLKSLGRSVDGLRDDFRKFGDTVTNELRSLISGQAASGKYSVSQWGGLVGVATAIAVAVGGLVTFQQQLHNRATEALIAGEASIRAAEDEAIRREMDLRERYDRELRGD